MKSKKIILYLSGIVRFIKRSNFFKSNGKFNVNLRNRCRMFLWGFYSDESILYDFQKYNRKDFLTDFQMCCKAVLINTGYTELLNNKIVFAQYLDGKMRIPKTYGYIQNGNIIFTQPELWEMNTQNNLDKLLHLLKKEKSIMVKLFDSGSGAGIYKLSMEGNNILKNSMPVTMEQLTNLLDCSHNHMLCEFIGQAQYSSNIFPMTCNTVKLLTMIDPYTNEAFLARAFHRFGTAKSFPVDNLGHGSCLSNINIETGVMGPTYTICNNKMEWITHHPDTGAAIDGIKVTNFHEVVNSILKIHCQISYIKYIAWDVVVQENGYILLEGNANTDMAGIQPFSPLLLNKRVRRFYQYYKVIKQKDGGGIS